MRQNTETFDKVQLEITERLYPLALDYASQGSLWDLLFEKPGHEGLTRFRNTQQGLSIPEDHRGDDGEEYGREFEYDDEGAFPPHSPEISVTPVADGLVVETMHLPDFNEYEDIFRLTSIQATLRTVEGQNIGFLSGRLYESESPNISSLDFVMVADSQEQDAMEMAEAVTAAYPRITKCFDSGAFLHVEIIELASVARGGASSVQLLDATLEHCRKIVGDVSAICIDVRPVQFPWFRTSELPEEVLQECDRVNKKLRGRLRKVLKHQAFADIGTRVVRYCYPENVVEKL